MSITEEESNFLRFYFLNLKVASKAVRVYFDYIHPSTGLAGELISSSVTLKGLRFITKQQLNILYPNPTRTVNSAEFDTTLIVSLLRNMTPRESAPVTGFDNVPLPGDTSTGADIARVKWYRNKLVHSEDGKLSPADFSQFWGDLEGAIGRLGGLSMLKDAQSAQHIVLDRSLEKILKALRNTERDVKNLNVSQEKHTDMINDLQTSIENQKIIKEQHENKIQQLHDSLQKGEFASSNLLTEIFEYKGTIDKCTEEIEAWKKVIEKNEETIKGIQEKVVDKQHQVDNLTHNLFRLECKYDKKIKEIDDKLVEHDKKMTSCVEEIDNIKKKHYHTDDTPGGSKKKEIEEKP